MSAPDEDLSEECKENLRVGLAFLDSDDCERHSAQRIDNDIGNIEAAAEGGMRILREHGRELCRVLIEPLISRTVFP